MTKRPGRPGILRRGAPAVAALSALAVVLPVLYVAAAPIWTADFWWHLAMGQVHAQHGLLLTADPLSHTARGAPTPHEWLFQAGLQAAHAASGFHGLRLLHGAAVLGVLALAFSSLRRASASPTAASLGLIVFVVLSWYRIAQLRPDLWSIACMLLLHRLLFEPGTGPSPMRIAAGAGVLLVWVNAHSLFLVGLLLIGAALAGAVTQVWAGRWLPGAGRPGDRTRARRLAVALGAGMLATLANPRGLEAHLTFLRASSGTELGRIADEWTPFRPFSWSHDPGGMSGLTWLTTDGLLLAFVATALGATAGLLRRPERERLARLDPVLLALGATSVVAMLAAQRFLWLGFFPLLWLLRALRGAPVEWALAGAAAVLALAFPRVGGVDQIVRHLPQGQAYLAQPWLAVGQPVHAVRFLQETGLEGNLFNRYSHGGFLGYWLAPDLRTFVDGRLNVESDVLHEYFSVVSKSPFGRESWPDVLERRGVDLFLGSGAPTGASSQRPLTFTAAHLEGHPDWVLVSRSLVDAVYLKRNARNVRNLERVARWYRDQGVPFDPERGFDPAAVIRERPDWSVAHGLLPATGLPPLESPDPVRRFRALDLMGFVYTLLGAHDAAIAVDAQAAALRPGAKAPRRRLAYEQLLLGRAADALGTARELLRISPGDPRSRAIAALAEEVLRVAPGSRLPSALERAFVQVPVVAQGAVNRLERRLVVPPLAPPSRRATEP
jgi:hypothetical protein